MDVAAVVKAISSALPARRPIGHHDACYNGKEIALVNECMRSGVTSHAYVERFEAQLSAICGVDNVIAMSSGTAALHVALMAAGVKPGDEVIVPALSFVATANAVCHAGAVPHFVDCSLNLSPVKLRQYLAHSTEPMAGGRLNKRTERRISAVIAVDLMGIPADMKGLEEVADAFGLTLIEDAAEALGSRIGNRMCGSFGSAAVLSFNNNKIVTTNGGGALLTNDPWIAAKAHQLSTTARLDHPWKVEHDAVAWNYRMGNLNAAFGLAQLDRLDEFLEAKLRLAGSYRRALDDVGGVNIHNGIRVGADQANHWLTPLEIEWKHRDKRDELLQALHDDGIKARAIFTPLHKLPMYRDNPRSDRVMLMSENTERQMICLPGVA